MRRRRRAEGRERDKLRRLKALFGIRTVRRKRPDRDTSSSLLLYHLGFRI